MKVRVVETDSNYIHFPEYDTKKPHELWDHCLDVEKEINDIFPAPIKLLFEEAIYSRFFILSKKRYMALKMNRDGDIKDEIEKRGVLLTRRDNSKVVRDIYSSIIYKVFNRKDKNETIIRLVEKLNEVCSYYHPASSFIITKSIGAVENYKMRTTTEVDFEKRLKELGIENNCVCDRNKRCDILNIGIDEFGSCCMNSCDTCDEYRIKNLPAHIQLAEKIRKRGKMVQVGSRMEYLICGANAPEDRLFNKAEDPEFQAEHNIKVDPLYYINLMINPFDEVLQVGFGLEKFMKMQYKYRYRKWEMMKEINKVMEYYGDISPSLVLKFDRMLNPRCPYVMTSGKNKGKKCGKNGKHNGYCLAHIPKEKIEEFAEIEEVELCDYIATRGTNKGNKCGKVCKKGYTRCSPHLKDLKKNTCSYEGCNVKCVHNMCARHENMCILCKKKKITDKYCSDHKQYKEMSVEDQYGVLQHLDLTKLNMNHLKTISGRHNINLSKGKTKDEKICILKHYIDDLKESLS